VIRAVMRDEFDRFRECYAALPQPRPVVLSKLRFTIGSAGNVTEPPSSPIEPRTTVTVSGTENVGVGTMRQRDLATSLEKVGKTLGELGDHVAALQNFEASLAIRQKLVRLDPGNPEWQRDSSEAGGAGE
jgi:hypothetical protein